FPVDRYVPRQVPSTATASPDAMYSSGSTWNSAHSDATRPNTPAATSSGPTNVPANGPPDASTHRTSGSSSASTIGTSQDSNAAYPVRSTATYRAAASSAAAPVVRSVITASLPHRVGRASSEGHSEKGGAALAVGARRRARRPPPHQGVRALEGPLDGRPRVKLAREDPGPGSPFRRAGRHRPS